MTRVVALMALALAGCGEGGDGASRKWDGGDEWDRWARGVEVRFAVGDAEGHGPDVGSEEWARALQRKLGCVDEAGHGPDLGSAEWRAAVEERITAE